MPNLVDLFGQISLFAKLTMAVAIVAFGLAVAYVFRPSDVSGVILGEVDFLAGAQAKVDAMIAKAKERATKAAM